MTHQEDYQQLYTVLTRLSDIPQAELDKLPSIFRSVSLAKDGHFLLAGQAPTYMGFVVVGLFAVYYIDNAGNDFIKAFNVESEFIGAYSAALSGMPSPLYIQALEDSRLLVVSFADFVQLRESHVCWQIVARKLSEALFMRAEQREHDLVLHSAESRYRKFLQVYPGLEKRLKQYQIASYLGITPVSLSRIRSAITFDSTDEGR
jgi:CRP-like cAMP-binding protein